MSADEKLSGCVEYCLDAQPESRETGCVSRVLANIRTNTVRRFSVACLAKFGLAVQSQRKER